MKMRSKLTTAVIAVVIALVARRAGAIERRPFPAFQLAALDGAAVASPQLAVDGQWLFVYVAPGCASCDRLLASFKAWQTSDLLARTVIVVGGTTDGAAAYLGASLPPEVSAIRSYADPLGSAWTALELTGTPMIIGVKDGTIRWSISGVLNDPRALESAVKTWVGQ